MNVVGPGITLEDYQSGKASPIDLFEGQIKEWILAFARYLAHEHEQREHSGIAVLLLTSAILEPLGGVLPHTTGAKNAEGRFCNGFVHVFPEVPGSKDAWHVGKRVCELLRHGLFHEAFIKAGVVLTSQNMAIVENNGIVYIDPVRFFDALDAAFVEVCSEIRHAESESPQRAAFDAYWSKRESEHVQKLVANVRPGAEYPPVTSTNTLSPTPPITAMNMLSPKPIVPIVKL